MPVVNSHTSWNRLEEVWLGDVYPADWYDYLDPEIRDIFCQITEITKEDLSIIENKLKSFGVKVRRPVYDHQDRFMMGDHLVKPRIMPRDHFSVIGNELRVNWLELGWESVLDEYRQDTESHVFYDNFLPSSSGQVRVGQDIYFDFCHKNPDVNVVKQTLEKFYAESLGDYRIHVLFNGGHIDSCFSVLRPGLIFASRYFEGYEQTFPGWHLLNSHGPEFENVRRRQGSWGGQSWQFDSATGSHKFSEHVFKYARDWIGDYIETIFEVNCLVIDEKNVMVLSAPDDSLEEFERHGITPHPMPFRARTFWDGGLHCLTLDVRRQSSLENFFPERNDQKITIY